MDIMLPLKGDGVGKMSSGKCLNCGKPLEEEGICSKWCANFPVGCWIVAVRKMPVVDLGMLTGETWDRTIEGMVVAVDWQDPPWLLVSLGAADDNVWVFVKEVVERYVSLDREVGDDR